MDSCDIKFRQIADLELQIRSSKHDAKNYLKYSHPTPEQISKQVVKTTERVKMYRKMRNLQKEKDQFSSLTTREVYLFKEYEVTFKVFNIHKRTQKHTHFIERNKDEVLTAIDTFDEFIG